MATLDAQAAPDPHRKTKMRSRTVQQARIKGQRTESLGAPTFIGVQGVEPGSVVSPCQPVRVCITHAPNTYLHHTHTHTLAHSLSQPVRAMYCIHT